MKRLFLVPVLGLATLAAAAPAHAQSAGWLGSTRPAYADGERQAYNDARRVAYDNGYREGLKEGAKEGRENERFRYEDERTFQRADKGYHREFGDLERYRQSFRNGYSAGYTEAYQRYGAVYDSRGGYGNGGVISRRDSGAPPYYPNSRSYPSYPSDSRGGYRGGYAGPAFQYGVDDGYEKGVEDARKNRSFDPLRHEWYRSGDRHYDSRTGSRQEYKDVYRQGFQQGYDRGYREGRYR
jgi:flagellar biosynthesis/type III secretory pathway protein FliH